MKTNKRLATSTFCKNIVKQFVFITVFNRKIIVGTRFATQAQSVRDISSVSLVQ